MSVIFVAVAGLNVIANLSAGAWHLTDASSSQLRQTDLMSNCSAYGTLSSVVFEKSETGRIQRGGSLSQIRNPQRLGCIH
jgi:hypothetical protein